MNFFYQSTCVKHLSGRLCPLNKALYKSVYNNNKIFGVFYDLWGSQVWWVTGMGRVSGHLFFFDPMTSKNLSVHLCLVEIVCVKFG